MLLKPQGLSFQEVLAEDWQTPAQPQDVRPAVIPEDTLLLSVQAQKALPQVTGSRKQTESKAHTRKDAQGNHIQFSSEAQLLSMPDNIAWETKKYQPE